LIENTYGNDKTNLREHYLSIKKQYKHLGNWNGLGLRRFEQLYSLLDPSTAEIEQVCNLLSLNSQKVILLDVV
jgi:hypothetical protein